MQLINLVSLSRLDGKKWWHVDYDVDTDHYVVTTSPASNDDECLDMWNVVDTAVGEFGGLRDAKHLGIKLSRLGMPVPPIDDLTHAFYVAEGIRLGYAAGLSGAKRTFQS